MIYQELSELGKGSFAKVFLVKDENGNEYAKKVFSPVQAIIDHVGEEKLKKRFIREVRYQNTIEHSNVVKIIEHNLTENPPYFIMPKAECTLKDELDNDPTLGANLKNALFDILAGLEIIHTKGFVHRDLKPANILRFEKNGKVVYAISDFGLITSNHSESSTLTSSHQNGGTQNYAAPELNGGFKRAIAAADIYSFGAILHDIFSRRATRIPYTELTLAGEIGQIISKCTKRNPIRRYESVTVLREDLYNILNQEQIIFGSTIEEEIVNSLNTKDSLNDEEWDKLFIHVDENPRCTNIFNAISEIHINSLKQSPELFNALGYNFCEYIKGNSFDFNYCDIVASKCEIFYKSGNIGLQAEIVITLLLLGTSHNRWYVEQKYMRMTNKDISEELAERICIELSVQEINFDYKMRHIEGSISTSRENLHPILQQYLQSSVQ